MKAKNNDKVSKRLRVALVATAGRLSRVGKSPDEQLGELFQAVQLNQVYDDGMTFVGLVPKKRVSALKKEYELTKNDPDFNLREFVSRHFHDTSLEASPLLPAVPPHMSARAYITWLWPYLTRTTHQKAASLFPLPYPYIVPGGRFQEQFYWDSYFVMLGLVADERWEMVHGMVRNYIFMADKLGFIPTANRSYFVSRSQPPFFAPMVRLLASKQGKVRTYAECLPTLINEYRFWMKRKSGARAVRLDRETVLNRYFDNKKTPRPESHREDVETAEQIGSETVFLDLRAGAESGWDFSSRWFADSEDIRTIHTTDFLPIDLNCLLYILESTIADGYQVLLQPLLAARYMKHANQRAAAIRQYMWDEDERFFVDFDFSTKKQSSQVTLAGMFALYAGIATKEQAAATAERLERDFLKRGGLVTTLIENGQQWDSPNGWAPLQWVAIVGLRKYGYNELADKIKAAWLHTVELVYAERSKMIEKYDVVSPGKLGGGGEYPLQDGFGWTNGVYAALHDNLDEHLVG